MDAMKQLSALKAPEQDVIQSIFYEKMFAYCMKIDQWHG